MPKLENIIKTEIYSSDGIVRNGSEIEEVKRLLYDLPVGEYLEYIQYNQNIKRWTICLTSEIGAYSESAVVDFKKLDEILELSHDDVELLIEETRSITKTETSDSIGFSKLTATITQPTDWPEPIDFGQYEPTHQTESSD